MPVGGCEAAEGSNSCLQWTNQIYLYLRAFPSPIALTRARMLSLHRWLVSLDRQGFERRWV